MKKCPNCSRELEDSMNFCMEDGAVLVNADEDATIIIAGEIGTNSPGNHIAQHVLQELVQRKTHKSNIQDQIGVLIQTGERIKYDSFPRNPVYKDCIAEPTIEWKLWTLQIENLMKDELADSILAKKIIERGLMLSNNLPGNGVAHFNRTHSILIEGLRMFTEFIGLEVHELQRAIDKAS